MTHWQSYTVRKVRGTINELCNHFKIVDADRAMKRMRDGWPAEEAVCKPLGQKRGRKLCLPVESSPE